MPDQRSAMNQYRYLDEKRVAEGLTPDEQERYEQLRALVGPAVRSAGAGGGFDVNAAAAQLRESLLPAGLRNRPPPTPVATPEPEPGDELSAVDALASVYAAQPFDGLEGAAPAEADALFDPAQLGLEPAPGNAYDPNAQPYDPNAAYDPNAVPYDPNAVPCDPNTAYDPNAAPYDPNVPPYDPNAAYDPNAQAAWDPNQPWDPNAFPAEAAAQPYDPNAQPYDPNAPSDPAAGYDPNAQAAWDPNQPWDPNAFPADAAALPNDPSAAYDPNAQPAWDPNQPWDPAALPADAAAQPYDPNATHDPDAPPYDPSAEPFELPGEAGTAPSDEASAWETAAPGEGLPAEAGLAAAPWDVEEPEPIEAGVPLEGAADPALVAAEPVDAGFAVSPEPEPELVGADDATPAGWHAEAPLPEPSDAALGEYDETGGGVALAPEGEAEALPFDASASSVLAGEVPEEHAPVLGEYDDTAGFSGAGGGAPGVDALPEGAEAAHGDQLAPPAGVAEHGFSLESGGSFGVGADAAAGEWAADSEAPPWENSPPFDVGAPHAPPLGDGSGYELAPPDGETFGAPLEGAPLAELAQGDEGETPSFELPSAEGGPAPQLDFSQPDFSAEEDAFVDASAQVAELHAVPAFAPLDAELGTDAAELAPPQAVPEPAGEADEATPAVAAAANEPGVLDFDVDADEDIPTIEATDIVEEIPEESPAPPPRSLEFEPLAPIGTASEPAPAEVAEATPADAPPDAPPAPPEEGPSPPPLDVAARAPSPAPAAPAAAAPPPEAPPFPVAGTHRVVVHTVEGQVKRGVLEDPDLASPTFTLASQPGQPGEEVATEKVKAIFFMLAPGEKAPAPDGKKVRVTFHDGRQVAGFSPDYDESGVGFFMFPGDTRTNTGRIWVYRSAVRQVTVS